MQFEKTSLSRKIRRRRKQDERGVAILTVLLLLLLLTGLSVAMVMSVNSNLLVNGYYRNFRGSFYAADSGLAIARQAMLTQVNNDTSGLGAAYNPSTTAPLTSSEDSAISSAITGTYGSWQNITGSGQGSYASSSWPEQYKITAATVTQTNCIVLGGTGTCAAPGTGVNGYEYYYSYSLTAQGRAQGSQAVTLTDSGYLIVKAVAVPTNLNFAAYGMFIDQYNPCSGGFLVPGTISGPVFTNGSWTFGSTGQYIFTDAVGQHGSQVGYQFADGTCDKVSTPPATSDTEAGTQNTIAPQFQNGFKIGQGKVPLPTDSYSQEQAVVDGKGGSAFNQSSPGNLKTISGTAFPTSGTPPNGVYLPYSGSGSSAQFTGGGILVQGDASITLASGSSGAQVYTIVQGSGSTAVTTTVSITPSSFPPGPSNYGQGTTVVTQKIGNGAATVYPAISGVPVIRDVNTNAITGDATMVYTTGNITSLSGPSSGAAIQDYTDVTVTSAQNINITGNITYKTEPVDSSDTLTSSSSQSGVLGIFTAGTGCSGSSCGNINLEVPSSGQNLEIDASLATISNTGSGGLINPGNAINTLTIVGGRIQNTIQNINTSKRNVLFDKRFANGAVSPPWFPSTTITPTAFTVTPSIQRLSWINNSPNY